MLQLLVIINSLLEIFYISFDMQFCSYHYYPFNMENQKSEQFLEPICIFIYLLLMEYNIWYHYSESRVILPLKCLVCLCACQISKKMDGSQHWGKILSPISYQSPCLVQKKLPSINYFDSNFKKLCTTNSKIFTVTDHKGGSLLVGLGTIATD